MASALDDLSFELFECKVCLEPILDKNPRILSCNHTFCQPCLEKLQEQNVNEITCPTCRHVTRLPDNDVSKLAANFDLTKMKEHETTLLRKAKDLCDICIQQDKHNKGIARCKDCNFILCDKCKISHTKTPVFSDHAVEEYSPSKLCANHEKPVKFVCLKCLKKMCLMCCFDEVHHDHKERIHSLQNAGEIMKQECTDFTSSLGLKLLEIGEQKENVLSYLTDQERELFHIYATFAAECGEHLKNVAQEFRSECKNIVDKIKTETKLLLEKVKKTQEMMHDDPIEKNISTLMLKQEVDMSLCSINQVVQHASVMNASRLTDQLEDYVLNKVGTMKATLSGCTRNIYQPNSAFQNIVGKYVKMLENGTLQISKPVGLIQQLDHSILLTDLTWKQVKHLDPSGQLVATYYPSEQKECTSISLLNDLLYISSPSGVSIIAMTNVERSRKFFKSVKCGRLLHRILACDRMSFYVSFHDRGCVVKVNSKDEAESVITGLKGPYCMISMKTSDANYILLTERGRNRVNIYDDRLHLKSYITGPGEDDQLDFPRDLCVTERNTVLVADAGKHRVSEYDLDGCFICHVLTKEEHGISWPCAISYKKPYLWMTELDKANTLNSAQVKLFKFE